MRVAIEGAGEVLTRALRDLVRAAGHEVVRDDAQLRIHLGGEPVGDPRAATLRLAPAGTEGVEADPRAGLARVLADGGTAVWPDPFDPDALLDVLAAQRRDAPAAPPQSGDALETSPHPWLGVDPTTRTLRWANPAARRVPTADPRWEASAPVDPGLAPVLSSERGRALVTAGGREWAATWWTDGRGTRVVGLTAPEEAVPPHVRSLADLGRASATLTHELRSPVASFAGALELLSKDLPAEDRREVAELARGRIAQMNALLEDTLRLARPFKGPPIPVDCAALLASAVEGVRTDPLFANVRVGLRLDDDAVHVLGYEQALRQAVTNLLVNAAQAQGGSGAVDVALSRTASDAVVSVTDEGPGIPEPLREKVFEPFWTTKSSGTGLGLAYVRRVVQACGGTARAEAAEGRGARLVLELPLAPTG